MKSTVFFFLLAQLDSYNFLLSLRTVFTWMREDYWVYPIRKGWSVTFSKLNGITQMMANYG